MTKPEKTRKKRPVNYIGRFYRENPESLNWMRKNVHPRKHSEFVREAVRMEIVSRSIPWKKE